MKSVKLAIALGILVVIAAPTAFAEQTPAARACRIADGQPWVISVTQDQVELCRFGRGMIGSMAFFSYTVLNEETQATSAYLNPASDVSIAETTCAIAGGAEVAGEDSNGTQFRLCQFADSSIIEVETLARGPDAVANLELTRKLRTRN